MTIAIIGSAIACGASVVSGNYTVLAGGVAVASVGDMTSPCPDRGPSPLDTGNYTVLVSGRPIARIGSLNSVGSPVITGNFTVFVA